MRKIKLMISFVAFFAMNMAIGTEAVQAGAIKMVGDTSITQLFDAIKAETNPVVMESLAERIKKKASSGDNTLPKRSIAMIVNSGMQYTALKFAEIGDMAKTRYWIGTIPDSTWMESTLVSAARTFIEKGKFAEAEALIKPYLGKPAPMLSGDVFPPRPQPNDYNELYGTILFKRGQFKNALPYLEGPKTSDGRRLQSSELYALALIELGENQKAIAEVSNVLNDRGPKSETFKAGVKRLYLKVYGNSTKYDKLTDSLAASNKINLNRRVSAMITNRNAPDIDLFDANGKKVPLKSLRGKTVIVDFWATWCIPCIASFPGMQKAVNYFKKDTSVVFMFVHTAERSASATADAVKMLKTRKYDFDLYMDLKDQSGKNPVSQAFDVSSLPTKFIINKDGVIRFKNDGYVSEDVAVEEIKLMIEMANRPYEKVAAKSQRAPSNISDAPKDEMVKIKAPSFTLKDAEGKMVSLQDFKGKVVVLDFWATWCQPCKASFPGMQAVVNKYKDDTEVKFLFIDTFERDNNFEKLTKEFIAEKKYTFHVLYDEMRDRPKAVATSFGVKGIPNKVVIDKEGYIRYQSSGGGFEIERIVRELSEKIDKVKTL